MSNARLILEMKILHLLTERYGFLFLFHKRHEGLYLPKPRELASSLQSSVSVAEHAYYYLQQEGMLSFSQVGLKQPYRLSRPQTFVKYLQGHLIKKLGTPKSYSLPREIREKPSSEIVALINQRLARGHDDALGLAIMHTAYLLPHEIYEKARIYRGKTPLCLLLGDKAISGLQREISIKPLPLPRLAAVKKGHDIPFPVNLDQPDLVIFHKEALSDFIKACGAKRGHTPILPVDPIINLLLLPLHPVRGMEAQERLAQILHGLYLGEQDG